jgi:hypothetical protein
LLGELFGIVAEHEPVTPLVVLETKVNALALTPSLDERQVTLAIGPILRDELANRIGLAQIEGEIGPFLQTVAGQNGSKNIGPGGVDEDLATARVLETTEPWPKLESNLGVAVVRARGAIPDARKYAVDGAKGAIVIKEQGNGALREPKGVRGAELEVIQDTAKVENEGLIEGLGAVELEDGEGLSKGKSGGLNEDTTLVSREVHGVPDA